MWCVLFYGRKFLTIQPSNNWLGFGWLFRRPTINRREQNMGSCSLGLDMSLYVPFFISSSLLNIGANILWRLLLVVYCFSPSLLSLTHNCFWVPLARHFFVVNYFAVVSSSSLLWIMCFCRSNMLFQIILADPWELYFLKNARLLIKVANGFMNLLPTILFLWHSTSTWLSSKCCLLIWCF